MISSRYELCVNDEETNLPLNTINQSPCEFNLPSSTANDKAQNISLTQKIMNENAKENPNFLEQTMLPNNLFNTGNYNNENILFRPTYKSSFMKPCSSDSSTLFSGNPSSCISQSDYLEEAPNGKFMQSYKSGSIVGSNNNILNDSDYQKKTESDKEVKNQETSSSVTIINDTANELSEILSSLSLYELNSLLEFYKPRISPFSSDKTYNDDFSYQNSLQPYVHPNYSSSTSIYATNKGKILSKQRKISI